MKYSIDKILRESCGLEIWQQQDGGGGHSVQISDGYVDNMMTLYRLRHPSGRLLNYT